MSMGNFQRYASDAWKTTKDIGYQVGQGIQKHGPVYAKKLKDGIIRPNESADLAVRRWSGRAVTLFLGTALISLFFKKTRFIPGVSRSLVYASMSFMASMIGHGIPYVRLGEVVREEKKNLKQGSLFGKAKALYNIGKEGARSVKDQWTGPGWNEFDKSIALPLKVDDWSKAAFRYVRDAVHNAR